MSAFARAQPIKATVGTSTILSYSNEFESRTTPQINRLRLLASREIDIPEGTEVKIGKNYYVIVSRFYAETFLIPKNTNTRPIKMVLPINTGVRMENGLGMNLATPQTVDFPIDGIVRLPQGLLLQQTDSHIKLTLSEEIDAVLVAGSAFK
jgi:hypothetical protein